MCKLGELTIWCLRELGVYRKLEGEKMAWHEVDPTACITAAPSCRPAMMMSRTHNTGIADNRTIAEP